MIFFLVANSKTSDSEDVIRKIKNLDIKEDHNFVFFNRFINDLKNPFWINFIKTNTKATFLFASRSSSELKIPNSYGNKKRILWGLCKECSICSEKYQLDKYFKKIFIFYPGLAEDCCYDCPPEVNEKTVHINKFKTINDTNLGNPSTGLLMYLFIRKYYPNSIIYLIGFENKGLEKFHKFDLEKIYFRSQKLPRLF